MACRHGFAGEVLSVAEDGAAQALLASLLTDVLHYDEVVAVLGLNPVLEVKVEIDSFFSFDEVVFEDLGYVDVD